MEERASVCAQWGVVWGERAKEPTHVGERARARVAPPFICPRPPGPALCKLGSARSAVLPEVLTLVLGPSFDLLLSYFCELFPSLSFSHRHFGPLFPILTTYTMTTKPGVQVKVHSNGMNCKFIERL